MNYARLLITDLDNTLYDWVTYFARSFHAMVGDLVDVLGVSEELLLGEFKAIHQHYGNSEQPFALLELPSVRRHFGDLPRELLKQQLDSSLHAFNSARKKYLKLYAGVEETLRELRRRGVIIVGHTEAIAVNALFRLETLGISDLFVKVYAIEGRLLPHPDPDRRTLMTSSTTLVETVPRKERKPNPRLLLDICGRHGVLPSEAVYVGDSLTRDIAMATKAGVLSAWARYGLSYDRSLWDLLVKVSHWSDADVKREVDLRRNVSTITPNYTVDSFKDLLCLERLTWGGEIVQAAQELSA